MTARYLALITLTTWGFTGFTQTITNGSVSGSPAANSGINNGNAVGWSRCNFSPDLCDVGFPSYSGNSTVTPVASPDGGTWLGMASLVECAETTITGLTVGANYTMYFYGANFGTGTTIFYGGPAMPTITIGTTSQSFSIPQAASTWNLYSMNFTADATTMVLEVVAPNVSGSYSNAGSFYASLDGFTFIQPLPVELIEFDATPNFENQVVHLNWATASEIENDYFKIEKSDDLISWTTVEEIQGSGTTTNAQYYSTIDRSPLEGTSYYRLIQYDFNGKETISEVKSVEFESLETKLTVYPNPSSGEFKLQVEGNFDKLIITDALGRVVHSNSAPITEVNLPKGVYTAQVIKENKTITSEKIVIQ